MNTKITRKTRNLLFLIFLLATVLRLFHLTHESLWTDEAFSLLAAEKETLPEVLAAVSTTEAAPFGYYFFLHGWIHFFGDSPFSVRFPSVLFSLCSLLVLFFIVKSIFGERIALASSFFFAISPQQILYAQEVRMYSLFTFLALLCAFLFFRLLQQEKPSRMLFIFYALSLFAAGYTNYLFIFLVLFLSSIIFVKKISPEIFPLTKKILYLHGFVLLFYFFHTYPLIRHQFFSLNTGLSPALVAKGVPHIFASLGLFLYLLPGLFLMALVFLFVKSAFSSSPMTGGRKQVEKDFFFLSFLLFGGSVYLYALFLPLDLGFVQLSKEPLTNSFFLIRHSLFFAPLLYTFLAQRILSFQSRKLVGCAMLFLVFISGAGIAQYYTAPTKAQWQEATFFLSQYYTSQQNYTSRQNHPLVLLDKGGYSNIFLFRYYFIDNSVGYMVSCTELSNRTILNSCHINNKIVHNRIYSKSPSSPVSISLFSLTKSENGKNLFKIRDDDLLRMLEPYGDFWLILSRNPKTGDYYEEFLDRHFIRDRTAELYGIKVFHYTITPQKA